MAQDRNQGIINRLEGLLTPVLLVMLAVILAWGSSRFGMEFDWTQNNRHSLSDASIAILKQIDGPVSITAYARDNSGLREAIRHYIGKYQGVKTDISLAFVNPDSNPDAVRELGIRINGELVFEYQGRMEHVRAADESTVVNALVRLTRAQQRWIASITGHGERDLLGQANHDLGEFGNHLRERGYRIQSLNLAEVQAVPDNTAIMVLAGPQLPLLEGETGILLRYLSEGGSLLLLVDPGEQNLPPGLLQLLQLRRPPGTIIDIAGQLVGIDDPTITMITSSLYGMHPSVAGLEYTSLFPRAGALSVNANDTWISTPLLMTGDHTWLESSTLKGEVEFNEDADQQGPLTIGLALSRSVPGNNNDEQETPQQRIVVVGDGDFLSNTYLGNAGNLDLGMRLVDWLSTDEEMIQIPARTTTDTQLTVSSTVVGIIGLVFTVVLPLLFSLAGLFIWIRRRRA